MRKNHRYKAVLFDFDGVLVDSELLHASAWKQVLTPYDLYMGPGWNREFVGVADEIMASALVDKYQLLVHPDDLVLQKREAFTQTASGKVVVQQGLKVQLLALGNIKKAVVTSSPFSQVMPVLSAEGILQLFDAFVCAEDVTRHKPNPDPYLLAAEKLDVLPADCIVLEDSIPGVQSARKAGMNVIAIHPAGTARTDADRQSISTVEAVKWIIEEIDNE